MPGDERPAAVNGTDQAPGAEFLHGPADSAVRHAIVVSQLPLGAQPRPPYQLSGGDARSDVVGDPDIRKVCTQQAGASRSLTKITALSPSDV